MHTNKNCQNVLCKVKKSCTEVAYVSQQPWIQNMTLRCSDLEILQLYMQRKVDTDEIFFFSEKTYFLVGQWTIQCIIRQLLKDLILMCAIKNSGVVFVLLLCCASHNSTAGARLFCTCSRPESPSCWGQDSDWRTRGWFQIILPFCIFSSHDPQYKRLSILNPFLFYFSLLSLIYCKSLTFFPRPTSRNT